MPLRSVLAALAVLTAAALAPAGAALAQSYSPVSPEMVLRMDRMEAEIRRLTGEVERLSFENERLRDEARRRAEDVEFRLLELEGIDPTSLQTAPASGAAPESAAVATAGAAAASASAASTAASSAAATAPGPGVLGEIPSGGADPAAATAAAPGKSDFDAEAAYQNALSLLQRGDSDGAERAFRAFAVDHPDSARGGEARFWMGEISYARSEYQQAARLYLDAQQNYPDDRKAPDALMKLGMSLARMGQTREACLTLREVPLQYPAAGPSVLRGAEIESRRLGCAF